MKRLIITVLGLAVALTLAGCEDRVLLTQDQRYVLCIEAGGDWTTGAWDEESCDLP